VDDEDSQIPDAEARDPSGQDEKKLTTVVSKE